MPNERDRDNILTGNVPEPDAESTAAERAHAKTFAEIVDKTLSGRTPAAMNADDRALLEVATVIRAASGNIELAASKRRSVIEDALRQAIGAHPPATSGSIVPITRSRAQRYAPWAIASASMLVAAAAVIVLWVRAPRIVSVQRTAHVPMEWTSRPADALIGPIGRDHAGDASARIDTIFADRLDGYRASRLEGRRKP